METIKINQINNNIPQFIIWLDNEKKVSKIDIYTDILKIHIYNEKQLKKHLKKNFPFMDFKRYIYCNETKLNELKQLLIENNNNYEVTNKIIYRLFDFYTKWYFYFYKVNYYNNLNEQKLTIII